LTDRQLKKIERQQAADKRSEELKDFIRGLMSDQHIVLQSIRRWSRTDAERDQVTRMDAALEKCKLIALEHEK